MCSGVGAATSGARGHEHMELAREQRTGVGAGGVSLEVGQTQASIGDDAVEAFHQCHLRERRQILQAYVRVERIAPEHVAVVRAGRHCVLEDLAQPRTAMSRGLVSSAAVDRGRHRRSGPGRQRRYVVSLGPNAHAPGLLEEQAVVDELVPAKD
jgi:hypothetical protein